MRLSEFQENVNIAKGAWVILIASASGMALAFGGRLILMRLFSPNDYGVFSLAWIILNLLSLLTLMGLQESSARQIAFCESRGNTAGTATVIRYSLEGVFVVGILISLALFHFAPSIASILNEAQLVTVLRTFAAILPFLVLIHLLASLFRGFGKTTPKVLFFDLLRNGLFPVFLLPVILLGASFQLAMWAFLAAHVVTCIAFLFYAAKRLPRPTKIHSEITRRSILTFSLPILVLVVASSVVTWTDTLMLSYYKTSTIVGLYNGAWAVAQLLLLPATAMAFLFLPTASRLFEQKLATNLKRSYALVTRWTLALAAVPLLAFLIFPQYILGTLFGPAYVEASTVLQLLTLAYAAHLLFGPNYVALTAVGKTRSLLVTSIVAVGLNTGLNILLIPTWGMTGAAVATAISFIVMRGMLTLHLYRATKVHPLCFNPFQLQPEDKYILRYVRDLLTRKK